jgi:hypothetical protein
MKRQRATHRVESGVEADILDRTSGTRRVAARYSDRPTAPPPPDFELLTAGDALREVRPSSRPTRPAPRHFETVAVCPTRADPVGAVADLMSEQRAPQTPAEIRIIPRAEPAEEDVMRLGSLERVAYVRWSHAQLLSAKMDHKSGFILSLVDGHSSIETIIDLSNMPRAQALAAVGELWSRGIIAFL